MASVGIKLETPQAVKLQVSRMCTMDGRELRRFQGLIQNELADREWAERSGGFRLMAFERAGIDDEIDTVMAEYVTVMLGRSCSCAVTS